MKTTNNGNRIVRQFGRESDNGFTVYFEYTVLPRTGLSVRLVEEYSCGKTTIHPWRKYADVQRKIIRALAKLESLNIRKVVTK